MSYVNHRPSILHRPKKSNSQTTTETMDSQYEREQQYWAGKAARYQQTQDRLLRSVYPTTEDKVNNADEIKQVLDQHYRAKEDARRYEEQQEQVWLRPGTAAALAQQATEDKPWLATTYTSYPNKEEEAAARRRFASQVAEENRRMMADKAAARAREAVEEREHGRSLVTDESSYWNLGAINDRWVPPERRRLSPRVTDQDEVPAYHHHRHTPLVDPSARCTGYSSLAPSPRQNPGDPRAYAAAPAWQQDPRNQQQQQVVAAMDNMRLHEDNMRPRPYVHDSQQQQQQQQMGLPAYPGSRPSSAAPQAARGPVPPFAVLSDLSSDVQQPSYGGPSPTGAARRMEAPWAQAYDAPLPPQHPQQQQYGGPNPPGAAARRVEAPWAQSYDAPLSQQPQYGGPSPTGAAARRMEAPWAQSPDGPSPQQQQQQGAAQVNPLRASQRMASRPPPRPCPFAVDDGPQQQRPGSAASRPPWA